MSKRMRISSSAIFWKQSHVPTDFWHLIQGYSHLPTSKDTFYSTLRWSGSVFQFWIQCTRFPEDRLTGNEGGLNKVRTETLVLPNCYFQPSARLPCVHSARNVLSEREPVSAKPSVELSATSSADPTTSPTHPFAIFPSEAVSSQRREFGWESLRRDHAVGVNN